MEFALIPLAFAAVSAVGAVVGGLERSAQLKAGEQSERQAAVYNQENATTELQIATSDADLQRRRGAQTVAEQTAALGQSGFDLVGSGTAQIEQSATAAEMDAMNIQYKGVLRSRGEQIAESQHIGQANQYKAARDALPLTTSISAATAFLSGVSGGKGLRIS